MTVMIALRKEEDKYDKEEETRSIKCDDNSISLFFTKDYSAGKCEANEPPDENSVDMATYYFEISCPSICDLTPSVLITRSR
jgi:hypothetical protein